MLEMAERRHSVNGIVADFRERGCIDVDHWLPTW
jgi:hypothetical protein